MAVYDRWLLGSRERLDNVGRLALARAVTMKYGVDLAFRPELWKIDNKRTEVLPDIVEHEGLFVGDTVTFRNDESPCLWGLDPCHSAEPRPSRDLPYVLLTFVKIVGKFQYSGRAPFMSTMGCILKPSDQAQLWQYRCEADEPITSEKTGKVLIFWAKSLCRAGVSA